MKSKLDACLVRCVYVCVYWILHPLTVVRCFVVCVCGTYVYKCDQQGAPAIIFLVTIEL